MTQAWESFDKTEKDEDEYETPLNLFETLCFVYEIAPKLDVCATSQNKKCNIFFHKHYDALRYSWIYDTWCNPPHSRTEDFVRNAYQQWLNHNINIIMIIPTNTMSSLFWHDCIEGIAEFHAIKGRIRFLQNGKPAKYSSRNAYVCVIWRKR